VKRLAALCLFALTACQTKDPAGTLTLKPSALSKTPTLELNNVGRGESRPIRLPAGDYSFLLTAPEDMALLTYMDCEGKIDLLPYGQQQGRTIFEKGRMPLFETRRINALASGLYILKVESSEPYCTPEILIQAQ